MPLFIIFKGSATGCIICEFTNPEYRHGNLVYMVQNKAWMDSRKYQDWVTHILVPFLIGQGLHVHNWA